VRPFGGWIWSSEGDRSSRLRADKTKLEPTRGGAGKTGAGLGAGLEAVSALASQALIQLVPEQKLLNSRVPISAA
jgi:hypothetical protein